MIGFRTVRVRSEQGTKTYNDFEVVVALTAKPLVCGMWDPLYCDFPLAQLYVVSIRPALAVNKAQLYRQEI